MCHAAREAMRVGALRSAPFCLFKSQITATIQARGNGIDAYDQVPGWLGEMGSVWEEIGVRDVWAPIGPWPKDGKLDRIRSSSTCLSTRNSHCRR